jgi:hypothetical protein
MSEFFCYAYNETGFGPDPPTDTLADCLEPELTFNPKLSLRHLMGTDVAYKMTSLGRSLYYSNKQSELTAFISSDGETMFFRNKLAKIFVCSGQVWAIFYRPNGKLR